MTPEQRERLQSLAIRMLVRGRQYIEKAEAFFRAAERRAREQDKAVEGFYEKQEAEPVPNSPQQGSGEHGEDCPNYIDPAGVP